MHYEASLARMFASVAKWDSLKLWCRRPRFDARSGLGGHKPEISQIDLKKELYQKQSSHPWIWASTQKRTKGTIVDTIDRLRIDS